MITITQRAAAKLQETFANLNSDQSPKLRVFVTGGGCSGLQYGMAVEYEAAPSDLIEESESIEILIDPRSQLYLDGASIDFEGSLMGGGFKIDNPNAISSCGCGHSFTPRDNAPETSENGGGCGSCGAAGY